MPEELQIEKSVLEICRDYPDNNSFAFMVNDYQRVHFRLEDPQLQNPNKKFRSKVTCLIITNPEGLLFKSITLIKLTDTIIPMTNRDFLEILKNNLKVGNDKLKTNYALYGFTEEALGLGNIYKTPGGLL